MSALTAYDFFTAKIMDEVGVHLILVGDSVGMAVLGYENTLLVTMDEMVHHTKAVARAKPQALLVADMPFMSYSTVRMALENAGRLIQAGRGSSETGRRGNRYRTGPGTGCARESPCWGTSGCCRSRFWRPAATRCRADATVGGKSLARCEGGGAGGCVRRW